MRKMILIFLSVVLILALTSCTQKTIMPSQNNSMPKQEANNTQVTIESQKPAQESNAWMRDQTKKFIFENCNLNFDETINKGTINEITTKGKIDANTTIAYMQRYSDGSLSHQWIETTWLRRVAYDYPLQGIVFKRMVIRTQNAESIDENSLMLELKTDSGAIPVENFSISITSNNNPNIKCIGKETK